MYGRTDGRTERKIELQRSQIERKRHIEAGYIEKRESEQGEEKRDKQKGLEIVIQIKGHGANKEKQMERVDDQGRDKGREGMWRDKEKRINREIYA